MIEVDHLSKYYGPVTAIRDLSFSVEQGEILGFLGPNGAGKTTTMRILTGFMAASSGRAVVAGYDVFAQALEVRQRVGYLPENVPLYREMTVSSYLHFVAEVKGITRRERPRKVGAQETAIALTLSFDPNQRSDREVKKWSDIDWLRSHW